MTYTDGAYTVWISNAEYSHEEVYHFSYPIIEFEQKEGSNETKI